MLGLGLRCVVARGGLLRARGREEGRDDRRQQHDHEKREYERRGVLCIFGEMMPDMKNNPKDVVWEAQVERLEIDLDLYYVDEVDNFFGSGTNID